MRYFGAGGQNEHSPRAENAGRLDRQGNANMKMDQLVAPPSTKPELVDRRLVGRTLHVALAAGSIVSPGMRSPNWVSAQIFVFLFVKLFFATEVVGLALIYLTRLA